MTIIPAVDTTARVAAAAANTKVVALRAALVAAGVLTADGSTPAPLPAITTTTTNATFVAGATTGTVVATLSAPPAGDTRTLLPGDGRLALNSTGTAIVVGLTASAAGTINATVQDRNASTGAVSPPLNVPVTVTAASSAPTPPAFASPAYIASIARTPAPGLTTPTNGQVLLLAGAGKQYADLGAALTFANANPTAAGYIIRVDPGLYTGAAATTANNALTTPVVVECSDPTRRAALTMDPAGISSQKALLLVNAPGTFVFRNLEIFGVVGPAAGDNWSAITAEGGQAGEMTVRLDGCVIYDCNDGLARGGPATHWIIDNTIIRRCGVNGDGHTHNVYVGGASVVATNLDSGEAIIGHALKSRCFINTINGGRYTDSAASRGSYLIDLPDGGVSSVTGAFLRKGPAAQNPILLHFGGEDPAAFHPGSSLTVNGNTFVTEKAGAIAVLDARQDVVTPTMTDNTYWGFGAANLYYTGAGSAATPDTNPHVISGAEPTAAVGSAPPSPTPTPAPTPAPVDGSILTTFGFRNYMAAPSPGLWRQGIVFRPGQVPAGSSIQVQYGGQPIAAQFDERVTRADGSLAYAVMHGRHTDFTPGETRSYVVRLAAGMPFDNSSATSLSAITGAHDFRVTFANLTETGNAGTTPVGSGGFQASFNTHMAVPTRREKHHSGAVCDGWTGWGMAADAAVGAADAHLQTIWHGDVWKNADGSTYAVEIAAEPAQHWWSIGAKKLRSYDAALLDGGTAIASYPSVQHHYHSRWLTVQDGGNNTRGKRHWIGGAQPTLTYLPDRAGWIASGMMPPLDLTKPCNPLDPGPSYTPGSGQGDRTDIDGTGAHFGRGVVTQVACAAFLRQTAEDYASARMSALAALHIPYHRRSNRTRTRPGDAGPDIANTVVAMVMGISPGAPVAAPPYDFTAQGMPIPVHGYYDGRTAPAFMDGFVPSEGGLGPWTEQTSDSSHAENISYGMYLLEGERYLMEATMDLGMNCVQEQIGLEYYGRPYVIKDNVVNTNIAYDAVGHGSAMQERSTAWCINNIASAAATVPDSHPATGHMRRLNKQQALYFSAIIPDKVASPDLYATGVHPWSIYEASGVTTPWQGAFNAMAAFHAFRLTGEQGFWEWGALTSGWALNHTASAIYLTFAYRTVNRHKMQPRAPDNLCQVIGLANGLDDPHVSVTAGLLTGRKAMANGAKLYASARDTIYGTDVTVPSELTQGQPYYVRDASGNDFRLSAAQGGAALAWASDYGDIRFLQDRLDGSADTSSPCDPPPNPDDSPSMNGAAVVEAYLAGVPGATLALVNKSANFLSLVDTRNWKPWSRAVPGGIAWTAPVPAPIPLPPGAVTGIAASNVSYNALTAGWSAPTGGGPASSYIVRYRPPGGGAWTTVAGISGPTVRLAGLVPATAYEVEVSAVNAGGTGPAATVTLSTIARPTTGYVVDIKAQQSVISDSQGSVHMGIHVTANVDDSHPASVLIGLTLSGTQPSNPTDTTGGSYNASGWAPCGIINYGGDIYYEIDFRMAGKPGTWTWVVQTPDGVHVAIPGAQQVVVTS